MKQKSLLTRLVLLLVMIAGAGTAWADKTVSYGWEDNDDATAWTITDAIAKTENQGNTGSYAGKINTNHTYVQFKEKVYVTSFSFAFKRTSNNSNYNVYIETSTDGTNWTAAETYAMSSFTNGSYTTKTKTFDGKTQYYVRFHCYNTTAVRYVDDVSITYSTGSPTCATPTFSPAGGTYTSAQNVTISTETSGATIYYTTDDSNPSISSSVYSSAINVSETTTIKAIAVADGYDNSAVATATYTIVTPITIAAARAQGTGSVLTKGVVTSCVGTTGYIQDATAAICVYGSSLTVGDEVAVSGTLKTYNGLLEITSPTVTVISSDNTTAPTVKTIAEINSDYAADNALQGLLVKIEDATVTAISNGNTTIAQGENTIVVRGIDSSVEYAVNDVISLTGNIGCFNAAQIANPTDVVVKKDPVLSVNPTTAATFTYEEGNGPSEDQMFTITGTNLTSTTITASVTGDFEITDNETYGSSLTLASGDIIAVRLKAGLAKGDYSGTLTLSTTGATDVTVSLSGSVSGTTYTISIDDDVIGGTIEADKASAAEGTTVTLTAKPDDAYTFGTWTVYKDDMTTTVTVTDNQFTMPNCEVYVTATFTAKPTYKVTCAFNDAKGLLTATPEAAYEGQSVKLEYTTEDGYTFSSIVITKTADGSATNIIPTASGNDYTFTMPGYAVTATATFVSNTFEGSFAKVTSTAALEDGGYYILYSTKAMNSTVASGKMGATEVTVNANNIIENPDRAIVWKLVKNGDNWDLYSEKEGKYCYIEGTNTSAFKMADAASYHYTVSVYDTGGFKFKTTHTSGRGINYGDNNFGSYADSNSPEVSLYKYMTLIPRNITFEGNGAKTVQENVNMYTQTVYDGVEATLEANRFAKDNHEFAGWATNSDGTGTQYADKAKVTVTGDDLTLYAQWNPLYTLTIDNSIEGGTVFITGNLTSAIEGKEITLSFSPTVGHAFEAWNVYKEGDATTKVTVTDNKFNMPAYNVVVSATFREATTYSLVTNANQIVSGKHYIIASGTDGSVKAMGEQKDNNRAAVNVTANDGVIPETTGVYEFVIFGPDADGHYVIYDETSEKEGYLYAASSSSNHLKTSTSLSNNGKWTITIDDEKRATIQAQGSSSRNLMRFNSTLFSCYASGQAPIYLFAKDNNGTIVKRTVHITAAGYATYCAENALEFTGSRMTAYIAKLDKDNKVTFEEVTCVPANTGVLLKGEEGDWNMNVVASSGTIVSSNKLVGVTEDTQVPAGSFVLMNGDSGVGFYKTTSEFTVRNHTAYMEALPTTARFIGLDNEATGIENINVNVNENGNWYNLNGQRVETPKKGLYIVNGKKIMVK